jgi:hypothetical protein
MHLHSPSIIAFAASLAIAVAACGDDSGSFPRLDAAAPDTATAVLALDGGGVDGGGVDGGPATVAPGLVAVNSDYSSSSVSLLDRDGKLLLDGCLTSGSGSAGMTMTLSGDVVLPTQVPSGGPVAIIDRGKGNDAIIWLDAATCAVRGQLAVGTGFHANPQDVVALSATKAYVVRQDPNPAPTASPDDFDEGNDVLVIDPSVPAIVGRIDLLAFAPVGVLPRGHRALLAGGKVLVSLNAISPDYKTYGEGRIAILDPATDQVTGLIDIPGAKNCGALTYVAAMRRLFVACGGAYGDPATQLATSAIVAIDLGQTPPAVVARVAAAVAGAPFSNTTVAALDGNTVLAVVAGSFTDNPPDSLWLLPFDGNAPTKIFASAKGFALGTVLFEQQRGRIFAADSALASPGYLRVIDVTTAGFTTGQTVRAGLSDKLPPRALAFY